MSLLKNVQRSRKMCELYYIVDDAHFKTLEDAQCYLRRTEMLPFEDLEMCSMLYRERITVRTRSSDNQSPPTGGKNTEQASRC